MTKRTPCFDPPRPRIFYQDGVVFEDVNLAVKLYTALHGSAPDQITLNFQELEQLQELRADFNDDRDYYDDGLYGEQSGFCKIGSLYGLDICVSLTRLSLSNHSSADDGGIDDLTPLPWLIL